MTASAPTELLKLIGAAYSDAFGEGMREHTSSRGGKPWTERKAYYEKALSDLMTRQAASVERAEVAGEAPVLTGLQEDMILMGFHNEPSPPRSEGVLACEAGVFPTEDL